MNLHNYCYKVNLNDVELYRRFLVKLEGKPRAEFWKKISTFSDVKSLNEYCSQNGISDLFEDEYVIAEKVEYFE